MMGLPKLVSRRWASRQLGLPGAEVVAQFEQRGWDVFRFGRRVRLRESDVLKLLEEARMPSRRAVQDRAKLIKKLAEEAVLQTPRRSPRSTATRAAQVGTVGGSNQSRTTLTTKPKGGREHGDLPR